MPRECAGVGQHAGACEVRAPLRVPAEVLGDPAAVVLLLAVRHPQLDPALVVPDERIDPVHHGAERLRPVGEVPVLGGRECLILPTGGLENLTPERPRRLDIGVTDVQALLEYAA